MTSKEISKILVQNNLATRNDNFYAWRCLKALGIDTEDGVVRSSMVHYNNIEDVDRLINAFTKLIFYPVNFSFLNHLDRIMVYQ